MNTPIPSLYMDSGIITLIVIVVVIYIGYCIIKALIETKDSSDYSNDYDYSYDNDDDDYDDYDDDYEYDDNDDDDDDDDYSYNYNSDDNGKGTFHHYKTEVDCRVTDSYETAILSREVVDIDCTATFYFRNGYGETDTKTARFSMRECDPRNYDAEALRHAEYAYSYMMDSYD